jgi:hypothetical protein
MDEIQPEHSSTQSDNAAFDCNDEETTKEEEVYQDLCAIQRNKTNLKVFIN